MKMKFNYFVILCIALCCIKISAQNSIIYSGQLIYGEDDKSLPAVSIEAYDDKKLIKKTTSDLDGRFVLKVNSNINRIVFTDQFWRTLEIENLREFESSEINFGQIKLYSSEIPFVRYFSRKAEREDRRRQRQNFQDLKNNGKKILLNGKIYRMKARGNMNSFSYYVKFDNAI
ncbi:hypothetical protein G3567_13035 [Psychroflexus sp. YR1-1]|uniref:CarboxypepD_reg-like domain-containing protein n=1 Tax=Psychroflexus aurantiacus TaxID=2709310 RepID=A0A6B3R3R6_9FLAO|nr:hypothetical protein [Psychroflexus aurantiacus]NEV95062.1 hypothetical protein [Psychroflexus aurantiacus]